MNEDKDNQPPKIPICLKVTKDNYKDVYILLKAMMLRKEKENESRSYIFSKISDNEP